MRVLCLKSPHLPELVMKGWANALQKIDCDFIFCDSRRKPIFDAFDENEPDIFISTVNDVTRGMASCLKDYPETKTLFYSQSWNEVSDEDKEYVEMLRRDTGKPDLIFSFSHESRLHETLGGWVGQYKTLSLMKAADPTMFLGDLAEKVNSDITVVGDYSDYRSKFVLPLCNDRFKVRIFGDGWPVPQGLGVPEDSTLKDIYSKSHFVVDVVERDYEPSDVPFNVAIAGGFCVSNSLEKTFTDFPQFKNPQELYDLMEDYHKTSRLFRVSDETRKIILNEHTYKHRMIDLLKHIGFEEEREALWI